MVAEAFAHGELFEPAGGFVEGFEGEFEGAVVHRDEPFCFEFVKDFDGFVGAHVDAAEGVGKVRADGKNGDFRTETFADFFEAIVVGAVAGVENAAVLVFDQEAAKTTFFVAEMLATPVMAGGECDAPVFILETLPPLQFNDSLKSDSPRQVPHAPRHDRDFGCGQSLQSRPMKMIEMGMRE